MRGPPIRDRPIIHSELDRGTLRGIIRASEISVEEFVKLLG